MSKRLPLLLILSLFARFAFAQPALAWAQRYDGPPDNNDEAHSIAVDNAGNIYVTGSAFNSNGTLDMVTIKYSPGGQQLWLQSYNGAGNDNDEAYEIVISDSGNVYVVGYSKGVSSGADITTIKYSSTGIQQWVGIYNGAFNNYDVGNALTVDAAGNVYVTGYETVSNYTYDFITIKYSPGGSQLWAQNYNGPGDFNDESRDIALDNNGNVYVTGPSDTFYNSQPNADIVLLKYDNNGALQWRRVYDSPGHGYEYSKRLVVDRNNDIIVAGYGFVTNNGNDYYILKYDAAGNFQWLRNYNYGANTFEEPWGIVADSLNNIIVTGQGITSTAAGTNDYVTVKYDAAGNFQWASRYDGVNNGEDRAYGIALDDSMNIYVTGFSKGTSTNFDIATVKYDPAGNQRWVLRYDNAPVSGDDAGNAIAVRNGDVYVTGRSANANNDDYITLRYSYSAIGIQEYTTGNTPLDVFPNPATEEVHILVPSSPGNNTAYSAIITNSLGETVETVTPAVSESTGKKDALSVNVGNLPAGIYFVKIMCGKDEKGIARFITE